MKSKDRVALTAGQLAKLARVSPETIRFYERKGLLPEPSRRSSGYREYKPGDAKRIQFIRRIQKLGFTLGEIKELLTFQQTERATCADVKRRTEEKLAEITSRIKELKRTEKFLKRVSLKCGGPDRPIAECPFLGSIEAETSSHA